MTLSLDAAKRMLIALGSQPAGNEVLSVLNNSATAQAQAGWSVPAAIIAAHTSTTTDFAALAVGDLVIHIPAVAGNSIFYSVVTAGTLPAAAVIGDLYVALRAISFPAASAVKL